MPDDANVTTEPVTPPAPPPAAPPTTPPATPPNDATTEPHQNDPHKFRRLFERADQELKTLKPELDQTREKLTTAETEAQANLRRAIAAEKGLPADALEFLTGTDEASLISQADRLAALRGTTSAPPAPQGGTTTQPPGSQTPSIDEQITAAEKAGNFGLSITLKRQKAGLA